MQVPCRHLTWRMHRGERDNSTLLRPAEAGASFTMDSEATEIDLNMNAASARPDLE
jgi:hypothetical protein